jgi:CMP-N-acetylneuraminic acid synthetase
MDARYVTRTVVSTDSWRYAELAKSYGAEAPFLRPAELARDESPTVETIRHALSWLTEHDQWLADVVVLLQPTTPLRTAADVDQALTLLASSGVDSVASVCPIPAHFHPQWQFVIERDHLLPYSGVPMKELPMRRQELSATYTRNGAVYAFRRAAFESTGSLYGHTCRALVMPTERSLNIDTMADWRAAESLLQRPEARREAS